MLGSLSCSESPDDDAVEANWVNDASDLWQRRSQTFFPSSFCQSTEDTLPLYSPCQCLLRRFWIEPLGERCRNSKGQGRLKGGLTLGMGQVDISSSSEGEAGCGGEKDATGKHQADLPV